MALRDRIAMEIARNAYPPLCNSGSGTWHYEIADKILAIIDGERCEWVKHKDSAYLYKSTCPEWDGTYRHISTFCPFCGKRIEVVE